MKIKSSVNLSSLANQFLSLGTKLISNFSEIFHMYEASMHIGELLLFRQVCVFFCIVVYRKEIALAYTLIKTDTPGFGISISNYNISFYV